MIPRRKVTGTHFPSGTICLRGSVVPRQNRVATGVLTFAIGIESDDYFISARIGCPHIDKQVSGFVQAWEVSHQSRRYRTVLLQCRYNRPKLRSHSGLLGGIRSRMCLGNGTSQQEHYRCERSQLNVHANSLLMDGYITNPALNDGICGIGWDGAAPVLFGTYQTGCKQFRQQTLRQIVP